MADGNYFIPDLGGAYMSGRNSMLDYKQKALDYQAQLAKQEQERQALAMQKQRQMIIARQRFGNPAQGQTQAPLDLPIVPTQNPNMMQRVGGMVNNLMNRRQPQPQEQMAQVPMVQEQPMQNSAQETVIVNGSRQLPDGGQYTPFQDQAAPLLEQAKQLYAIGDTEGANAAFNDYQKTSQAQQQQIAQTQASVIGAAINGYKVPDDPTTPVDESSFGIQSAIRELEAMGMPLTQQQIDRLMDNTKRGYQAQVLQNLGNPEVAVKQNIETQGTYNQYRAPDIRDFGGSIGAVGTMPDNAGQMVGLPIKKTVDPNNIYNQQQQNYRNTQDNKTRQSIEGARLSFNRDQAAFDRQYKLGLIDLRTRDLKIKESAAKNGIYIGGIANTPVPADDLPEGQ